MKKIIPFFLLMIISITDLIAQRTSLNLNFNCVGGGAPDSFKKLILDKKNNYKLIRGTVSYGSATIDSGAYTLSGDTLRFTSDCTIPYMIEMFGATLFVAKNYYKVNPNFFSPGTLKSQDKKSRYHLLNVRDFEKYKSYLANPDKTPVDIYIKEIEASDSSLDNRTLIIEKVIKPLPKVSGYDETPMPSIEGIYENGLYGIYKIESVYLPPDVVYKYPDKIIEAHYFRKIKTHLKQTDLLLKKAKRAGDKVKKRGIIAIREKVVQILKIEE